MKCPSTILPFVLLLCLSVVIARGQSETSADARRNLLPVPLKLESQSGDYLSHQVLLLPSKATRTNAWAPREVTT